MRRKSVTAYQQLSDHFQKISHFEHFAALGDWDQATMMPSAGSDNRAAAMAELARHIHELKNAPELTDWFAEAQQQLTQLSKAQQANLREMLWQWHQANCVPAEIVQAKTAAAYRCEHQWRQQRPANDWQGFKHNLQPLLALVKEEAQSRAAASNITPYDALLARFEPGMTAARLTQIFDHLSQWLPTLIQQICERQPALKPVDTNIRYPLSRQQDLGREVMQFLGFDFQQGRLDISAHPFCGGVPGDVRLTTRYNEHSFLPALLGIIHETGHASYEQGLPVTWRGQPAGLARSMGIHESQSLFFEMQLAGSAAFIKRLYPMLKRHLSCRDSAAELHQQILQVQPGYIRVDADEVTYPCHIMLRFAAEQALLNGSLDLADLPDFWDQQMQQYLGISTKNNYRDGCMQDIHWAVGEFGYFPSYTLGAMYAAQFRFALEKQLGSLDVLLENDRLPEVLSWLQQHIWQQGSLLDTDTLVQQATGEPLNPDYLHRHLRQRYLS